TTSSVSPTPSQLCHLLPTGETCLHHWQTPYQQGIRTFKAKIAVFSFCQEWSIIQQLLNLLPPDCKLRLDANGGLTPDSAQQWLQRLDYYSQIEFLEQPLPPQDWTTLCKLSQTYQTPLALDESVATLSQLQACYHGGWRGIFVIKAAIAGSPRKLRQFCQTHSLDLVFSSVFETPIGMQAAFRLAQDLASPQRALGYGISHWINSL
ncbi:MAG: o-succinylbenzoate synthase, partial [Kamptonema sp. SIO4C4]|nr:o-succinylbenzoate synthase [Kamptonema sp. SIO4C4]